MTMTCGICLEKSVSNITIPCNHIVCTNCLLKWTSQTCPFCRKEYLITLTVPHRIFEKHVISLGRTRLRTNSIRKDLAVKYMSMCINNIKENVDLFTRKTCIENVFETLCNNQWMLVHKQLCQVARIKLQEFENDLPYQVGIWRKRLFPHVL